MSPELHPSQASTTMATTEPAAPDTRTHLPARCKHRGQWVRGRWAAGQPGGKVNSCRGCHVSAREFAAGPQQHGGQRPMVPALALGAQEPPDNSPHMLRLNWWLFTEA